MPDSNSSPVALITGASMRIGLAIAISLHDLGYKLILHFNNNAKHALELAETFNKENDNCAIAVKADLCDLEDIKELAQISKSKWNRLDLVINNAAIFETDTMGNSTPDLWQKTMEVNVRAGLLLSQTLYPTLQRTSGCIINLADIYAERPLRAHSIYSISKAGVEMLTKAHALEFAPNVRVNGISPGAILWPDKSDTKSQQNILDKIPLARCGSTNAIVETIRYLIRCDYITGQIIKVDGGRSLTI